jgi:hypothetical protein
MLLAACLAAVAARPMSSGEQLASLFTICLTIQERLLLAAPSR